MPDVLESIPSDTLGPILEMRSISKTFSGVNALIGVDFVLHAGEVHALMGENGAGKSTLMKILTGLYQPDEGRIFIDQQPVTIRSPKDALHLGIAMIHQELNPVRDMSVAANLFLGKE